MNHHLTAEKDGPLLHASQTHVPLLGGTNHATLHVETFSIVFYSQDDIRMGRDELDDDPGGFGMLQDIVEAFLNHPVEIDLSVGIKAQTLHTCTLEISLHAVSGGKIGTVLVRGLTEAHGFQTGWPKLVLREFSNRLVLNASL